MNIAYTRRWAAYRAAHEPVFACPGKRPERVTALPEGFSLRTRFFTKELDYLVHASESVLLDPDYELYDDINFDRWDGAGGLRLRVSDAQTGAYSPLHLPAERVRDFVFGS